MRAKRNIHQWRSKKDNKKNKGMETEARRRKKGRKQGEKSKK